MKIHGLTSQDAVKKLEENIQDSLNDNARTQSNFLQLCCNSFKQNDHVVLTSWIGLLSIFVVITTMIVFAAVSETTRLRSLYLEMCIVFGFACLMVFFCVRESYLKANEIQRLIEKLCLHLRAGINWTSDAYPDLMLPELASISLIAAYRDENIVNIPWNLLVEGDVIILGPSRIAPARCKQLLTELGELSVILEAGETYYPQVSTDNPNRVFPRQLFEITEAPIKNIIRCYCIQVYNKRPPILTTYTCAVIRSIERYLIFPVFLLTLIVNVIRLYLLNERSRDLQIIILMYQSYVILPLIPILYPILFLVTRYYGSCRVQYLATNEVGDINLQFVLKHLFDILLYNLPDRLPRNIDLVSTLGSITTFCCIDKEGILCHPNPIPEKIFFFKREDKKSGEEYVVATTEGPGTSKDGTMLDTEKDNLSNCIEVMSLSPDPKSCAAVQFDDIYWEVYNPSLRPIGANILLNSPCLYPMKTLREDDFIRHVSLSGNAKAVSSGRCCLCSLASYFGLNEEILKAYKTKQRGITYLPIIDILPSARRDFFLSIVKEKHVPQMISSVVNIGNHDVSQVFTQGSGDIVLETCTDLWNGEEICSLKDPNKKKALNFFRRMNITRTCIAFAYRPMFDEKLRENDVFHMEEENFKGQVNNIKEKTTENDITYEELLETVDLEDLTLKKGYLKKQIFLGMITMTHALKEDLIGMIERLDIAGIRFVHFSYENELLSRVFCERLGLETGWNCHISLAENSESSIAEEEENECDDGEESMNSDTNLLLQEQDLQTTGRSPIPGTKSSGRKEGETTNNFGHSNDGNSIHSDSDEDEDVSVHNQPYFEPYFLSNRSKLPKGIHKMRTHLSEIDDVPLLVPLFTDCNAAAVQEMMGIMQDYGDVVCCLGSSLNARNYGIFEQSDVSISMEPLNNMPCPLKQNKMGGNEDEYLNHLDSAIALSAFLNSIACSLHVQRKGRFPIGAMVKEARRFVKGCKSAFVYILSSLLSLTFLQMFSCIIMLPPPVTGLNIIWLSLIIIPLFGLSLIGSSSDNKLMKMLTGKRRRDVKLKNEFLDLYAKHFLPTFVLNFLFVALVLYPWLLFTFCKEDEGNEDCHWFHGASSKGSMVADWNFENGYFYMVHDFIVFYLTLSFGILSVAFHDRTHFIWKKGLVWNRNWCLAILVGILLEFLRTFCSYQYWRNSHQELKGGISNISFPVYIIVILWLVLLLVLGEFFKRRYIRDYKRFQKRERLKFDTKLGMNSPV